MSGSRSIFANLSPLYTDLYQLKMAQGYFFNQLHNQKAVFDLHYRHNPYKSGYVIACGLNEVLEQLSNLHFQKDDLEYLAGEEFDKRVSSGSLAGDPEAAGIRKISDKEDKESA